MRTSVAPPPARPEPPHKAWRVHCESQPEPPAVRSTASSVALSAPWDAAELSDPPGRNSSRRGGSVLIQTTGESGPYPVVQCDSSARNSAGTWVDEGPSISTVQNLVAMVVASWSCFERQGRKDPRASILFQVLPRLRLTKLGRNQHSSSFANRLWGKSDANEFGTCGRGLIGARDAGRRHVTETR